MLVVLPARPRRAWLRAFGVALALWGGFAVGVLAPFDPWQRAGAAAAVVLVGGIAAAWRPGVFAGAYRAWNKGARLYARAVESIVLLLCYGIVTVVGLAGSSLRLRRPDAGESLWYPRSTLSSEAYGSQHDHAGRPRPGATWRAVWAWGLGGGNQWAIVLVPFLLLLAALDRRERRDYPAGIYTLF